MTQEPYNNPNLDMLRYCQNLINPNPTVPIWTWEEALIPSKTKHHNPNLDTGRS